MSYARALLKKDYAEEVKEAREAAEEQASKQSIGSTIGGLMAMAFMPASAGIVAKVAASAGSSYIGGKLGGATAGDMPKDTKFVDTGAMPDAIDKSLVSSAIQSGIWSFLGHQMDLKGVGGDATQLSDKSWFQENIGDKIRAKKANKLAMKNVMDKPLYGPSVNPDIGLGTSYTPNIPLMTDQSLLDPKFKIGGK